jgi:choice-of-anchor A domain-containing protein
MTVRRACWVVGLFLWIGIAQASTVNPFTDLGSAGPANYAILAMGGDSCSRGSCGSANTNVNIQNYSEIDGNIGVAPNGNLTVSAHSRVYMGQAFVDTAGTVSPGTNPSDSIPGGYVQNSATNTLLNSAVQSALLASTDAASMSATFVNYQNGTTNTNHTTLNAFNINNPTGHVTITGTSGINVVNLSNLVLSSDTNDLTLVAPTNGYFVINVSGNFALSSGADINLSGGLSQYNVLYNVTGSGSAVNFVDSTNSLLTVAQGIVLAPTRDIIMTGSQVDGEIISGNLNITLNFANVDVPEPATLFLLGSGLVAIARKPRKRAA